MSVNESFNLWLKHATSDKDLINELRKIKDCQDEIFERFYKNLEFGTAGLRGIMGVGPNRMNIYTVRLASQGLANYIRKNVLSGSVAISYDSRNKSDLFAKECARVLASNGIKVYLVKKLQPTPTLSFAVRYFKCDAGIMITASHNTSEYNGFKCYGEDGCQMTDEAASAVFSEIKKVDIFKGVKLCNFDLAVNNGLINFIEDDFYDAYMVNVLKQRINKNVFKDENIKVVYTPLHGTGNEFIKEVLKKIGVNHVEVVKEQELPDGNFPTCKYPNPETEDALKLALEYAKRESPDVIIATDPDCDRVGIAVKNFHEYRRMTGNEVGILLAHYILSERKRNGTLCDRPIMIKTIVSSQVANLIAKDYGCKIKTVFTGFKYIGEQILRLEEKNEEDRFVFGFEESYGYLIGTYVRDKDAVVATMLICEMIAYYKKLGKNLVDVLNELYEKYGFYKDKIISFELIGSLGMKKIEFIMSELRRKEIKNIASFKVFSVIDYLCPNEDLPKSNVLLYSLENGSRLIIRPSGTEPKIKVYVTAVSDSEEKAELLMKKIVSEAKNLINNLSNQKN